MFRLGLALCAVLFTAPAAFGGPIHDACKAGDLAQVVRLLDANPTIVEAVDENGWTPIQIAANNGKLDVCKALVARGAKVDAKNKEGNTALTGAALNNHLEVVELLIKHGANVNNRGVRNDSWPDNNAETALHFAVRSGNPKIIGALLEAGANPMVEDGFRDNAIAYAVKKGRLDIARIMARKAGVPVPDTSGAGSTLTQASPTLSDDMAGGGSRELWEFTPNGGSFKHAFGGLELATDPTSKAYPGLRLRAGALTTDTDWRVKFVVRYAEVAQYGRGWGLTSATDPKLPVFYVHADWSFPPRIIAGPDSVKCVGKEGWSGYPESYVLPKPNEWMTFEVVNNGGAMAISLDGKPMVTVRPPAGEYRLWFGPECNMPNPGPWDRVVLRSLELQYLKGKEPGWVASARTDLARTAMTESPLSAPTFSLAAEQLVALGGVDTKAQSPLQLAGGGRMRVTARSSKIQAPPLAVVEFAPIVDRPDFEPLTYQFVVNGKEVDLRAVAPKARVLFSFDLPAKAGILSRVQIVARDAKKTQVELLRAEVRTVDPALLAPVKLGLSGEKVVLENAPSNDKGIYLYAGTEYIGRLTDPKAFAVDARRVPAGQHEFYVVATNEFGDLLTPTRSLIEIKPRYAVSSPLSEGVFTVEGGDIAMPWTFSCLPGAGIVKTRVYMRGTLVAESDKPSFEAKVPLSDVPSGQAILNVVGVAADGTLYAPEMKAFKVRNYYSDSLIARDNRAKTLQDMISQISQYDQQVVYWYSMAVNEPAFRTYISGRTYYTVSEFGRMSNVGYIDTFTVPGRAEEYFARCKAAIVERAEFRLRIGKLQKQLGMKVQARSTFAQVIYEVGEGSGIGLAAAQETAGL